VKVALTTVTTHNPFRRNPLGELLEGKPHEQFLWGGAGNGPGICQAPRQSLTRQLFFRWIKMHLRVKAFFGTSENAVKSQIWIAVSVYVLVAIIRKRLNLTRSLYEMLQILSLNLFEKNPLDIALSRIPFNPESNQDGNQLILL
jgi:hypothetical protein